MDTFEDCRDFAIGEDVLIHTPEGYRTGIVASIDEEARVLTFTNGTTVVFPMEDEQ